MAVSSRLNDRRVGEIDRERERVTYGCFTIDFVSADKTAVCGAMYLFSSIFLDLYFSLLGDWLEFDYCIILYVGKWDMNVYCVERQRIFEWKCVCVFCFFYICISFVCLNGQAFVRCNFCLFFFQSLLRTCTKRTCREVETRFLGFIFYFFHVFSFSHILRIVYIRSIYYFFLHASKPNQW